MLCVKNNTNNPYFNTAAEEYILENFDDEHIFMLWQNEPCVYLGIHQNAYAEINLDYARINNINVVRRLSGGGCVYHDMGNINFSFFSDLSNSADSTNLSDSADLSGKANKSEEYILNFEYYTRSVINALKNLGVNAELIGRNDLLIDGMKFSGNAQCLYTTKTRNPGKKKLLHHGTILFDADMSKLAQVLTVDEEKIKSKSVKSVKSRVTNVLEQLSYDKKMSAEQFKNYLENYIISENENNCKIYNFSSEDIKNIQYLADNYYYTPSFIYGSNLKYSFRNKKRFDFGTIEICFNVRDYKITDAKIYGDFFTGTENIETLEVYLNGISHEIGILQETLCSYFDKSGTDIGAFIKGCDIDTFIGLFI